MKLWWVHLETMIATLMAFQHSKNHQHLEKFKQIFSYSFEKVKRDDIHLSKVHIFYCTNSFHSFIHCLVSTRRRRVGWILRQRGKSKNELQRWTIQRMLPCAESPDDM